MSNDRSARQDQPDPQAVLAQIRGKIKSLTQDYSNGKLNAAQFNAIYRHYTEKRLIIEKLIERNPQSDAWRAAAAPGATAFLRERYESRPLYYVVFRHGEKRPLMYEGKLPQKAAQQVHQLLKVLWMMQNQRQGLARKSLGDGLWLLMMVGEKSLTIVIYFLQPSPLQINRVRDYHRDFERANIRLLERGAPHERYVFPQRALIEK